MSVLGQDSIICVLRIMSELDSYNIYFCSRGRPACGCERARNATPPIKPRPRDTATPATADEWPRVAAYFPSTKSNDKWCTFVAPSARSSGCLARIFGAINLLFASPSRGLPLGASIRGGRERNHTRLALHPFSLSLSALLGSLSLYHHSFSSFHFVPCTSSFS